LLTVLEAGKTKIKALIALVSVEGRLLINGTCGASSRGGRGRQFSGISSIRVLIPFTRAESS
jgi:hypothetical protein